jgi:transposase
MAARHDAAAGRPWKCRFIDLIGRFIDWDALIVRRNDIRTSVWQAMFHVRRKEWIAPFL